MPFSKWENQVFGRGYRLIAGIDEVGRGPLAGPVAAAAVMAGRGVRFPHGRIRDSKQLSAKQREEIFEQIRQAPEIEWRLCFVWPKIIDRMNIFAATQAAWRGALNKLSRPPNFLFLDGNAALPRIKIEQKAVVKGDEKILLLAVASIMAKVSRDRLMDKLAEKFPQYGFERHKGYGTKEHLEKLTKYGPCELHRKSFAPVFERLAFREKVLYVASRIPRGQTMTYRQVAEKVGHPIAYRAVGNVLNKNYDPKIPCHRVVRSSGDLGGYNRGRAKKREMLEKEGCH